MKQPIFKYENGHAICEVKDDLGRIFKGEARCHPEDEDYASELTGCTIAEYRAQIEAARTYRNDTRIKLTALNQLLYSMNQSSNFSPKSYEAKMLYRQIRMMKEDLEIAKHQLAVLKLDLYEYMRDKDELFKKLRKNKK